MDKVQQIYVIKSGLQNFILSESSILIMNKKKKKKKKEMEN